MKISTASKKVLASALSAAMVVAFAPTVAFGADLGKGDAPTVDKGEAAVQVIYKDKDGNTQAEKFSANVIDEDYGKGIQGAFDFAAEKAGKDGATVQLLGDITADVVVTGKVTIDLNGYAWTNAGATLNEAGTAVEVENAGSAITVANNVIAATADVETQTATLVAATDANKAGAMGYARSLDGLTPAAYKMVTKTSSDKPLYIFASEKTDGDELNLAANSEKILAAGEVYTNVETKTVTVKDTSNNGKLTKVQYVVATKRTVAAADTVEIDGVKYVATDISSMSGSDGELEGYSVVATSKTVTKGTEASTVAADVTIKDSSEAKTGTVSGIQTDANVDAAATTAAKPAVSVASGSLTIKGGTFTTGAADLKIGAADATLQAISGTVASMENATVEVIGGTYTTGGVTRGQTVKGVTVSGLVKKSTVKATAGDYGDATALVAAGNVEESTIEAVAGAAADTTYDAAAIAIDANNTAAVTYKKVTATAAANGSNEISKKGSDVIGTPEAINTKNSDASAVTINSGSLTGERAAENDLLLKGGQYSKHIADGVGTAATGTVPAGFGTVCMGVGSVDYVYTKSSAVKKDLATEAAAAYKTAVETAIDHVYEAAIKGEDPYAVGYAFAEGYDAAALAAIVTDADEAANLKEYVDVTADTKAKSVTAPATLNAEEVAFNGVVEAVDAAAAANSQATYGYANIYAGVKYQAAGVSVAKAADVLSLSDLGLTDKAGDSVNHGDAVAGTKANAIEMTAEQVKAFVGNDSAIAFDNDAPALTTPTKSAASFVALDGEALSEVAVNSKNKKFQITKLGGYSIVASNGEAVKDELQKEIDELAKELGTIIDTQGKTIDELNAIIASLKAELADKAAAEYVATQDRNAVENVSDPKTKTVKLAKGVTKTKKAQTITYKTKVSASGNVVTYAKRSGSSKITVAAGGTVKLAKGVKKGTYTAKVKVTCGEQTRTVTVKFVVK